MAKHEIDAVTGTETTGHEWDGITELNTPLPRWWLWMFYLTIVWAIGYWIVYPVLAAADDLHARVLRLEFARGDRRGRRTIAGAARRHGRPDRRRSAANRSSPTSRLLDFARAQGRAAFADNCAPCHGAGGGGAKGYPNLNDDDWLWGGKLDDIAITIRHGVRSTDDKTPPGQRCRPSAATSMLERAGHPAVADYHPLAVGIAGHGAEPISRAAKRFSPTIASPATATTGKGNREIGAPDLTDQIWLYGPGTETSSSKA